MKRLVHVYALIISVAVFFAVGTLFARDQAQGSFHRTLTVSTPVDLDVATGSGRIEVRTGDKSTVIVDGEIHARDYDGQSAESRVHRLEANPPIEQNGNIIRIGPIEDSTLRNNVSISYVVTVPQQTRVHASTGSGEISVDGVQGPLTGNTGSGHMSVRNIQTEVQIRTGSGGIELDSVRGAVRASAGSGSIRAVGLRGDFTAETGSGEVTLETSTAGNVNIETGSGSVEATGVHGTLRIHTGSGRIRAQGEQTGQWRLQAGSGNIQVQLPPNAAFDLYAHTGSGNVTSNHPITMQGVLQKHEIQGKVRGGGFLLDVRTGSGNIGIE